MMTGAGAGDKPRILMCPPDHFEIAYAINPWMDEGVPFSRDLARRQWDALVAAITGPGGAAVCLMDAVEGLPDLVFTANAAFVSGNQAIVARYRHAERQGEESFVAAWFEENGFEVIRLPDALYFEGAGDALIWRNPDGLYPDRCLVFAGYRTRTAIASHSLISTHLGLPVLSLELMHEAFYHVDVCLCPLQGGYLLYAPESFDEYGNAVIEANVPPDKRITVAMADARRFACNAVNLGETVILNQGSTAVETALSDRGFRVIPLDMSEFIKAGGSAKCLTLRLNP
ncbi:MAG: dimethylarginine dimethylaminohydrolase family protein [Candidatus Melainabacteria bacterium]